MKKFTFMLWFFAFIFVCSTASIEANARQDSSNSPSRVNGYYRSNGTYVSPHYRSTRDNYHNNNWSVQGNVNPYTGKPGTKERR
jgi:hypothetical protein